MIVSLPLPETWLFELKIEMSFEFCLFFAMKKVASFFSCFNMFSALLPEILVLRIFVFGFDVTAFEDEACSIFGYGSILCTCKGGCNSELIARVSLRLISFSINFAREGRTRERSL